MQEIIKIGTRGSNLALWQTRKVEQMLREQHPELEIEIEIIKTCGDEILDRALSKIEGKGLFTKEIELKLLDGSIDIAVHSLKDMPTDLPKDLELIAICNREDASEALLSKGNLTIKELAHGCTVLTGSLRRRSQLLSQRPDLLVQDVRGNIETRLRKFHEGSAQAMILATAGLKRLGLEKHISFSLDPIKFIPACGQGALAIEARSTDNRVKKLLAPLDNYQSRATTETERSFLAAMGGGCHQPMGAYCHFISTDAIQLTAFCGQPDGSDMKYSTVEGLAIQALELGRQAAREILVKQ